MEYIADQFKSLQNEANSTNIFDMSPMSSRELIDTIWEFQEQLEFKEPPATYPWGKNIYRRYCEYVQSLCKEKVKGMFCIAQYPVRSTAQSALHFPPLTDLFIPTQTRLLREVF